MLRYSTGMILVLDNYDSFTWNLVHYLQELGAETEVVRNDAIGVGLAMSSGAAGFLLSPGPCTPNEAGICLDLVAQAGSTTPILGVCLGHQAIGSAYGGTVTRADVPMHGKLSRINHEGQAVFRGINGPFSATRYHSLVVERGTLPDSLAVTAETDDGTIMGLSHVQHPVHGVQFHPESILSDHGHRILGTFLELAAAWRNGAAGARAG